MLALSRCLLSRATTVLLDEVSMGLAPLVVDEIFEALAALARRGIALLLVEQYVSKALELAEHVYVLNRGAVAYSGPASGLDERAVAGHYLG